MTSSAATDSIPTDSTPAPSTPNHSAPNHSTPNHTAPNRTAATGSPTANAAADGQSWLTAVLRPAGSLDQVSVRKLAVALSHLAAATNMVVVDVTAAGVGDPRAFARALRDPAAEFERAGGCLLVTGAHRTVAAELAHAAVQVVTLADNAIPAQAAARPVPRSPIRAITQTAA